MNNDVWIGALLSIPIGVGTGLLVTPAQRWLENRGKTRAFAKAQRSKSEYDSTLFYLQNPEHFTQYLVQVGIKTALIGAAIGIVEAIFFIVGQSGALMFKRINVPEEVKLSALVAAVFVVQFLGILSSVMIVRICLPALRMWQRVRNFKDYAPNVPADIRDIQQEEEAGFYGLSGK